MPAPSTPRVNELDIAIGGRLLRTACLRDEYYTALPDPAAMVAALKAARVGADLFTFVQELDDREPHFPYVRELDDMAVLPVTTYKHWFDKQIRFKPRNKLKKAIKLGVQVRPVEFDDELLHGIMTIYNETRLRQGKANWHYGKDLETLRREHASFADRSEFIGAYFERELIGFAKITHSANYSIIMNIVAKVAHRDKSPTNALIAKAVECVAERRIPLLNFGVWGRRGLNEFKVANAFERFSVPRYHVPLTLRGELALKLGLHRSLKDRLPEHWIVAAANLRDRINQRRYREEPQAAATPTEPRVQQTSLESGVGH
ncbi:MAG TPA: hypothetical protein VLA16_18450 [Ideonella sp.]|nr:hypothetical protein [Ideonella sp.]